MGMLDRYRKKGGFIQLLNLLETTETTKREKFLKMIAEESPSWEAELKKKMLTFDRVLGWNQAHLMEITPKITATVIAAAVSPLPVEKRAVLMAAIGFSEKRKVEEILAAGPAKPGEIASSQNKILSEIRAYIAGGNLKFLEKADPDMVITEGIEDVLNHGGSMDIMAATMSTKEIDALVPPAPAGLPAGVAAELTELRKRVIALTQENQKVTEQVRVFKDKLEQIKKIA
jgi:hypothetical protein